MNVTDWMYFCQGKTCKPSMGYSFAAGTTDGPGDFDFTQGHIYSIITLK